MLEALSTCRPHNDDNLFYIAYCTTLITHILNNYSCFDIDDVRISGWISPVGSTIFQCRATAQHVEIASWLYLTVLISFKWYNITISGPEHKFFNK